MQLSWGDVVDEWCCKKGVSGLGSDVDGCFKSFHSTCAGGVDLVGVGAVIGAAMGLAVT